MTIHLSRDLSHDASPVTRHLTYDITHDLSLVETETNFYVWYYTKVLFPKLYMSFNEVVCVTLENCVHPLCGRLCDT